MSFFRKRSPGRRLAESWLKHLEQKKWRPGTANHPLRYTPKLMEYNHAPDGDLICIHCQKALLCKSTVYALGSVTSFPQEKQEIPDFFLHKHCASPKLFTHPTDKYFLFSNQGSLSSYNCNVCHNIKPYLYCSNDCESHVCLSCTVPLQVDRGLEMIQHWSHPHLLRFMERCATFDCDACNKVATDSSYMCDTCPFWIHKSCAVLSRIHLFGIHGKHPLRLSDSLPEIYRKFKQFCKICKRQVHASQWLYYCDNCRFFAHVPCTLSTTPVTRQEDCPDDPKLMHLPAPDEPSLNLMMENCVKDMISPKEDTAIAPPHQTNHWSHQHALSLKNKSAILNTYDHLYQELERLMICGCCTKPISPSSDDTDVFYQCSQCNYSLHRYCARFPKEMHHRLLGMLRGFQPDLISDNDTFYSYCCEFFSDGIRMSEPQEISFDVWCVCLPEKIKHHAHHHPLENYCISSVEMCEACRVDIHSISEPMVFGCISCKFYIHMHCLLKPATVKHRWDPHPLRLVRSVEDDVEDHPHDFECEFCSNEIDTNTWFYHCSICDLSFHLNNCMNPYDRYSNVKQVATNIMEEAHHYNLTFDLNKTKPTREKYYTKGIRFYLKIHPYKF